MASEGGEHEDRIVRILRALILAISVLCIAAWIVGSTGVRYLAVFAYLPAGWVALKPRWPQITIWIMWASTWGMLAVLMSLGPHLLQPASHRLLASAAALLFIAVPFVRSLHRAPSLRRDRRLPEARLIRRD